MNEQITMELVKRIQQLERRIEYLETVEYQTIPTRYETNAGQSISDSTTTIINYEDEIYDPGNAVTTGEFWKFTAPHNGYYFCYAQILYADTAWTEGERSILQIYKNGNLWSHLDRHELEADATTYLPLSGGNLIWLDTSDYIDFRTTHNQGGAVALIGTAEYNNCCIFRI